MVKLVHIRDISREKSMYHGDNRAGRIIPCGTAPVKRLWSPRTDTTLFNIQHEQDRFHWYRSTWCSCPVIFTLRRLLRFRADIQYPVYTISLTRSTTSGLRAMSGYVLIRRDIPGMSLRRELQGSWKPNAASTTGWNSIRHHSPGCSALHTRPE